MSNKWIYENNEAKRKDFVVFWIKDGTTTTSKDNLQVIGKGIEDMAISANPETSDTMDILGDSNFSVTGYKKSMTVDPVKVSGIDYYSQLIDDLDEHDATLDELEQYYLCVKKYKKDSSGNMRAWIQKGVIELGDFATGLEGVSSTHTIHYVGEKMLGVIEPSAMKFTIDAGVNMLNFGGDEE